MLCNASSECISSLGVHESLAPPPLPPSPPLLSCRDYVDISIAVATPKGLVVPVLRSADTLSFAGVEKVCVGEGEGGGGGEIIIQVWINSLASFHPLTLHPPPPPTPHNLGASCHPPPSSPPLSSDPPSPSSTLQGLGAMGKKARDGTFSIDDMAGGTFTIRLVLL